MRIGLEVSVGVGTVSREVLMGVIIMRGGVMSRVMQGRCRCRRDVMSRRGGIEDHVCFG